ncbi:MAG: F0F1 ATP synthase subunit A [Deltaproteobacteria bacterium]|jgi:F-type H+-transporting ATPase subunit a|nr:F0F1 ATP synthase subunit A [Deltaproteobacteria bacterium]MCL5880018.1 F0F1 ATP synthase subunit A [Deltaproteobacteria bacterium]MDA8304725.1 F0F1 ATP synthase subunit A [Deltaproteobacteria bacterium]
MLKAPILISIPGLPVYWTMTILVMVIILSAAFFVGRNLKVIPNGAQSFFELIFIMTEYFLKEIIGEEGGIYLPLIASFAIFILFSNLIGSIPGFTSPTATIDTTATLALIVFFLSHIVGIKKHGAKYIKKFLGPLIIIAPIMIIIEIMSALSRPFSHALRLFANIFAEEFMVTVLLFLLPWVIPVIMMYMQVFTDLMQAFVFYLLAIIYIALSLEEEH